MIIANNIKSIKESIPSYVTLVAVSKTKPVRDILKAYNIGHKEFGENKVQELIEKAEKLPKDIKWHMIGHLQRNKVKYIAPFVHLIHSVDSLKLLKEINKRAMENDKIIKCLLQVYIAQENSKFGFISQEIPEVIKKASEFSNIKITGLMGMASFTSEKKQIETEFNKIKKLFDSIKNDNITTLSIGMSSDYIIGIKQGSNMIRVGSSIFGTRN